MTVHTYKPRVQYLQPSKTRLYSLARKNKSDDKKQTYARSKQLVNSLRRNSLILNLSSINIFAIESYKGRNVFEGELGSQNYQGIQSVLEKQKHAKFAQMY